MGCTNDRPTFDTILAYELRCAQRYRRFVSVVLVGGAEEPYLYRKVLARMVRESDELAQFNGYAGILMAETSPASAQRAVERFKLSQGRRHGLRFSIASFPADGSTPDALLDAGRERLHSIQSAD